MSPTPSVAPYTSESEAALRPSRDDREDDGAVEDHQVGPVHSAAAGGASIVGFPDCHRRRCLKGYPIGN